jgi:hypothetical protein
VHEFARLLPAPRLCAGGKRGDVFNRSSENPANPSYRLPLTGDLYRAWNGNWYTIFLVTPDGIILGDPISPAFATGTIGTISGVYGMCVMRSRLPLRQPLATSLRLARCNDLDGVRERRIACQCTQSSIEGRQHALSRVG